MAILKDTDVSDKRVILEDGADVGTLTDIYVDTLDWRITRFDIKLEKRYAERVGVEVPLLKKPVISVPIHLLKSVGDVVHLKGSVDDLAKTQKTILPAAERRKEIEKAAAARSPSPASKDPAKAKSPPPPPKKEERPEKKEKPRAL